MTNEEIIEVIQTVTGITDFKHNRKAENRAEALAAYFLFKNCGTEKGVLEALNRRRGLDYLFAIHYTSLHKIQYNPLFAKCYAEIVVRLVTHHHKADLQRVQSGVRYRDVVDVRHSYSHALASAGAISLKNIGSAIGGKDHATIIHSRNLVNNLMEVDKVWHNEQTSLINYLKNHKLVADLWKNKQLKQH